MSLVKSAGLSKTLSGKGAFGVFAPDPAEAFKKMPTGDPGGARWDPKALKRVLLYHAVAGRYPAARVVKVDSLKTLAGPRVRIPHPRKHRAGGRREGDPGRRQGIQRRDPRDQRRPASSALTLSRPGIRGAPLRSPGARPLSASRGASTACGAEKFRRNPPCTRACLALSPSPVLETGWKPQGAPEHTTRHLQSRYHAKGRPSAPARHPSEQLKIVVSPDFDSGPRHPFESGPPHASQP